MSNGQKNFVKGAALLGGAGLIVKIVGAIFRIPLGNIIDTNGMAAYQVAYPVYAALVVISTAGLPTAISKLVSERIAANDYKGAHKVFQSAFKLLLVIGIVSALAMYALSGVLSNAVSIPSARLSLIMIAPSLFFVSILSAYRGYFQGLQMMSPTAFTQIIEQLVKLGAGLYLAWLWFPKGAEYGAAGALLGVSISEFCSLAVIIFMYNRNKKAMKHQRIHSVLNVAQQEKSIMKSLIYTAIPITLGACLMPIVNFLDTLIVTNTMSAVDYSMFNPLAASDSFALLTGYVNPLINMPAVLSLALCISLVPAISEARTQKNPKLISARAAIGFRLAILIGVPCTIGMYILSGPIMSLLYFKLTSEKLVVATQLLQTLSIGVLFLTMLQTMTGVLQGAGRVTVPVINLAIGALVKVAISIILIRVPSVNINGAALGTVACYGIAAILNLAYVIKLTKPSFRAFYGLLMPLFSSAVMGALTFFMYRSISPKLGNTISTLLCIAAAVVVYVVMLFVTKSISKDDMNFMPGGRHVTHTMNKLGFWED